MRRKVGKTTWTALLLRKSFTEANAVKESLARRTKIYEVAADERISLLVTRTMTRLVQFSGSPSLILSTKILYPSRCSSGAPVEKRLTAG